MKPSNINRTIFLATFFLLIGLSPAVQAQMGGMGFIGGGPSVTQQIVVLNYPLDFNNVLNLNGTISGQELSDGDKRTYEYGFTPVVGGEEEPTSGLVGYLSVGPIPENQAPAANEKLFSKAREHLKSRLDKIVEQKKKSYAVKKSQLKTQWTDEQKHLEHIQQEMPILDNTPQGIREQLATVNQQKLSLQVEIAGLKAKREAILRQINKSESVIPELQQRLAATEPELKQLMTQLAAEQAAKNNDEDRLRKKITEVAREIAGIEEKLQEPKADRRKFNDLLVQTEIDLAGAEARLEVINKSQILLVEEVRNDIPKYESISAEMEIARQNLKSTREAISQLDRDALAFHLVEIVVLQDDAAPSENTEEKPRPK